MASETHSRLIRDAARAALSPLGFQQKGQSRLWVSDRGYWALVIEFQPSGWAKGSYLNICASWLWHPGDSWTFNYYDRADGFIPLESIEQFRPEAETLAGLAASKAMLLSRKFGSLDDIAAYLKQRAIDGAMDGFWTLHGAAVSAGLTGDQEFSLECFRKFLALNPGNNHFREVQAEAAILASLLMDGRAFHAAIQEKVQRKRAVLKLPPLRDIN